MRVLGAFCLTEGASHDREVGPPSFLDLMRSGCLDGSRESIDEFVKFNSDDLETVDLQDEHEVSLLMHHFADSIRLCPQNKYLPTRLRSLSPFLTMGRNGLRRSWNEPSREEASPMMASMIVLNAELDCDLGHLDGNQSRVVGSDSIKGVVGIISASSDTTTFNDIDQRTIFYNTEALLYLIPDLRVALTKLGPSVDDVAEIQLWRGAATEPIIFRSQATPYHPDRPDQLHNTRLLLSADRSRFYVVVKSPAAHAFEFVVYQGTPDSSSYVTEVFRSGSKPIINGDLLECDGRVLNLNTGGASHVALSSFPDKPMPEDTVVLVDRHRQTGDRFIDSAYHFKQQSLVDVSRTRLLAVFSRNCGLFSAHIKKSRDPRIFQVRRICGLLSTPTRSEEEALALIADLIAGRSYSDADITRLFAEIAEGVRTTPVASFDSE